MGGRGAITSTGSGVGGRGAITSAGSGGGGGESNN